MMKRFFLLLLGMALFFPFTPSTEAQEKTGELEKKVESIEDEMDELRSILEAKGEKGEASVKTTIGGYGELHYSNFQTEGKDDVIDFHRFVLFFGHEFNDWIKFDSELEVEHVLSGEGKKGEVELEQAYLDFLISRKFNVRAGLFLVPVGFINEFHEPPTFYGVERPDVEKMIIPTTWWEAGVGAHGDIIPGLKYKLYFISSLDGSKFRAKDGIRAGRQKVSKAKAEDFAITGRLEFTGIPGLKVGASLFRGDTSQGDDTLGDATVTLWDADIQYSKGPFDFKGLYAHINVGDADKLNAAAHDIGEELFGWYVEGAFRFLGLILPETEQEAAIFARYERYNTQDSMPSGFTADPKYDLSVTTVGLNYKPHPRVVLKFDYQNRDNESPTVEADDQFNVGIGYMF